MSLFPAIVSSLLALAPPSDVAKSPSPAVSEPMETLATSLEFVGFDVGGDGRLAFDAAAVDSLRQSKHAVVHMPLSPAESITLDLRPFEVIAPDAKLLTATRDGATPLAIPGMVFLRGEIAGEPLSHAFLALSRSGAALGVFTRGTGEQWRLGVDRREAQPALVLRRGVGDVPEFDQFCSVIGENEGGIAGATGVSHGGEGAASVAARGPRLLNVAIDSDEAYSRLFGDSAAALEYMAMVVAAISDIYQRDLDMTLALRFARVWPAGGEPFTADDLFGFREYWQKNEDLTGLNLVHMFSGVRNTSYGGIAFLSDACTQQAFAISAFLLGGFPAGFLEPNLGNWDVNVVSHEMGHNLGTPHTHDYDPPVDTCAQGSDERGTIMSYCHTRPGGLLNIDMRMHAVTQDLIAADNPFGPSSCLYHDCNGNLIDDSTDVAAATSADVNGDGVPDECQDCNGNGVLDPFEIMLGAADVNVNGIPDSCEADCNSNAIPDHYECAEGLAADVNGNRVPDGCEPDCDNNGVADFLDIATETHSDVDRNSVPDVCDDCNGNGQPDWIDVDRAFNVFIAQAADLSTSPVREYHAASGVIVGDYPGSTIQDSTDLAFGPDGQLYVVSVFDFRVVKVNVDTGVASTFITQAAAGFTQMSSIVFGPDGSPYTASPINGNVRKYNAAGAFVGLFADVVGAPWDMAFGPNGNLFVLTDAHGVQQIHGQTGALLGTFVPPTNLAMPRGMCFLPTGELLITNRGNNTVRRFSAAGADLGVWNDEFPVQSPWGITVGPRGRVFLARESAPVRVAEYTMNGRYIRSFIRGDDDLVAPRAIVFRPASLNDGNANGIPDECEGACQGDVAPAGGDAQVNIDDLLSIISAWGPCPQADDCPADIAPVGGNGFVDIDDLLMVISRWGPCP